MSVPSISTAEREAIDERLESSQQWFLLHYCGLLGFEEALRRIALAPRQPPENTPGLRLYRED
jgi:hypothetical protein